jgi:hypothetical protein
MRKKLGVCTWVVLLAAALGARAQGASVAESQENAKPPGKRLRLQFQETRQQGDAAAVSRTSTLLLHADAGPARLFVGTQLAITKSDKEGITTTFKNAGVAARVGVTALPEGYRLDVEYEDSQKRGLAIERAPGPVTGGNPLLRVVKARSGLTLREGESVPFASAIDPVTGELVRIDLTLAAAPPPKPASPAGRADARLRAQLVLNRRQGTTTVARRPYAVLLQAGDEKGDKAQVFSGSQLPVQTVTGNNQVAVALKDVGAGLAIRAQRLEDGRYRLNVEFSDGVLSPGEGAPELHVFQSESELFVREGETLTLASAVDPQTGETVEAELTLEGFK